MTSQEDYAAVMPTRCPVTGEPFFMVLPDGQCPEIQVPTYGGPIRSGTIPEWDDEEKCWYRSVYDHDDGFWMEETEEVQGAVPLWANAEVRRGAKDARPD